MVELGRSLAPAGWLAPTPAGLADPDELPESRPRISARYLSVISCPGPNGLSETQTHLRRGFARTFLKRAGGIIARRTLARGGADYRLCAQAIVRSVQIAGILKCVTEIASRPRTLELLHLFIFMFSGGNMNNCPRAIAMNALGAVADHSPLFERPLRAGRT